ncbi:hypothetical protein GCM10027089_52900 [Nocardia thraciensis]
MHNLFRIPEIRPHESIRLLPPADYGIVQWEDAFASAVHPLRQPGAAGYRHRGQRAAVIDRVDMRIVLSEPEIEIPARMPRDRPLRRGEYQLRPRAERERPVPYRR